MRDILVIYACSKNSESAVILVSTSVFTTLRKNQVNQFANEFLDSLESSLWFENVFIPDLFFTDERPSDNCRYFTDVCLHSKLRQTSIRTPRASTLLFSIILVGLLALFLVYFIGRGLAKLLNLTVKKINSRAIMVAERNTNDQDFEMKVFSSNVAMAEDGTKESSVEIYQPV